VIFLPLLRSFILKQLITLLGLITFFSAQANDYLQQTVSVGGIVNGPQPELSDFAALKEAGITTVISTRTPKEMSRLGFDEQQVVEGLGMKYFLIPMGSGQYAFSPEQTKQLQDIIGTSHDGVFMHCRSGFRSGALLAAHLVQNGQMDLKTALTEIGIWRLNQSSVLINDKAQTMDLKQKLILLLSLSMLCTVPVNAGLDSLRMKTMRCGNSLIEIGIEAYYLLEKCGEPEYRYVTSIDRDSIELEDRINGGSVELETESARVVETWVYKFRRGRLTRILTVSGGILTDIRVSDRD